MNYRNWTEEDLEELDRKFDALTEYLGVSFVFEKVSDGSDAADVERVYIRPKRQIPAEVYQYRAANRFEEFNPKPPIKSKKKTK